MILELVLSSKTKCMTDEMISSLLALFPTRRLDVPPLLINSSRKEYHLSTTS